MRCGISDDGRLRLTGDILAVTARNNHHVADATCAPQANMRFQQLRVQDVVSDNKAVGAIHRYRCAAYYVCNMHKASRECNTKWKKTRPSGDVVLHSVGAVWI